MTAVIVIILIFVGGYFVWRYKKKKDALEPWQKDINTRGFDLLKQPGVKTPAGHTVHYEVGTAQQDLAALDRGIEHTYQKGECAGYPVKREDHDVHIIVLKGEISPEQHIPCYRVAIGAYDPYWNSEFDMMKDVKARFHYILASGQVLAVGVPYGDVIMIPDNGDSAFQETVAGYENEHCVLAWYDGPKDNATRVHGAGQGHPIIPECPPAIPKPV